MLSLPKNVIKHCVVPHLSIIEQNSFRMVCVKIRDAVGDPHKCFRMCNIDDGFLMACKSNDTQLVKIFLAKGTSGIDGIEQTIADEFTPPVGVVFSHPVTEAGGVSLDAMQTFPEGNPEWQALWIKLILTSETSGYKTDFFRLAIGGTEL